MSILGEAKSLIHLLCVYHNILIRSCFEFTFTSIWPKNNIHTYIFLIYRLLEKCYRL